MADFTINDFSLGWIPGDDPINGRKNGLLRMENVELDSNGALTLSGGCAVKQSGFSSNAHTLYSRLINGARHDYLADTGGVVYRDTSALASGGDSTNAGFGSAFNFTLIANGNVRLKDSGSGSPVALGILPPTSKPDVVYSTADSPYAEFGQSFPSGYVDVTGSSAHIAGPPEYIQATCDANGIFIMQTSGPTASTPYLLNVLVGVGGDHGFATDEDFVQFYGYTPYPWGRALGIDVLLVDPDNAGTVVTDYYTFGIEDIATLQFSAVGVFTVKIRRKDFTRVGFGSQDWDSAYGFRLSYAGGAAAEVVNFFGNDINDLTLKMTGGSHTQQGQYQYVQVNVNNTGSYLAKSVIGPLSFVVNLDMGQTLVTAQDPTSVDSQTNEAWIYRKGGLLDQWYRIKVLASAYTTPFYDTLSDLDALALNLKINLNLVSVASSSITDKIFDILGPINGRWYYFTTNFIYPSDINNPDLVDASLAVRMTGSSSELFMWARQINDTTILVGTSMDVYTLNGTFATYPDNSIDIYYRSLSCKYPPLTCDAEVYGGMVYYLANTGWHIIDSGGGNPSLVSPNLDRLYLGETVEGYQPPNLKILPRSTRFPVVIARNKLWCFITGLSAPRIEVYDFVRQYWRVIDYNSGDVSAAVHTQDAQVLAFFSVDKKTREIGIPTSKLIDGTTRQIAVIKTLVHDGQTPHQRKDSSTLKVRLSNSDASSIGLYVDSTSTLSSFGISTTSNRVRDVPVDLSQTAFTSLCKTYQVQFTGTVSYLTIDDFNITYDLRPEQRSFVRVQSNNYGTTARKKIASVPFQIDTLGNSVTVSSFLDGAADVSSLYISTYKASEQLNFGQIGGELPAAADFEYTLHSSDGLFEFFGFQEPRIVETYPQTCLVYNIPASNFGNAMKKRLRTWPFVLSAPNGSNIGFTPLIDGVAGVPTNWTVTDKKLTYRHYFKTDVFGVDYGGYFTGHLPFEVGDILLPEIVQILPIAKRFDQVGPEEFFRYGKIKQIELRVMPFGGSSIPFKIYFNDATNYTGAFTVVDGKEATYFIMLPKGTSGNVCRIELGPTDFDFHRFYTRLLVTASGNDTDLKWINL